jgi:general secretion pathway protein L
LAVTIALIVFYFGYDYKKLRDRYEATRQQVVQVFNETLPEVTRVVNPVQQLQVRINEIRKTYSGRESGTGQTVIALLTEISARIPTSYHVVVKRMVADSDVVRIKAVTKDFNTVDNVQKELEKSSYFQSVTISAANQSPKKEEVSFELKLELL